MLVFNDAHADSRVLKTAVTLREAGAEVRIFASARERTGYPAGAGITPEGTPIHRSEDFELARVLAGLRRRLPGGRRAAPPPPPPPAPPEQPGETAEDAATPAPGIVADVRKRLYDVVRLTWFWVGTARAARAWRPDVVHANDANTLVPALALEVSRRTRTVYDSHELWRRRNVRPGRWLAPFGEAVLERVAIRRAAGVITVSPSIAAWLRRTYRLPVAPTLVRNIPVSTGAVPDPARGRLRELAGLAPGTPVVAYCGGITTGRGLEETVRAVALLPSTHMVMLGYGADTYIAGLLGQARALGVGDRVHLAGAVPPAEVPAALADADVSVVFVRPICLSYRFSLPNKLFESIHAGLPVVAANLPDTAAIVEGFGVGRVFDAGTPQQLADAIAEVLAEPEGYRRAARAAAGVLTWQAEAEELVGLYHRVLTGERHED